MIEDCVRRLRFSNYYKIDQELIKRKVKLIYEIISDIACVEPIAALPKLSSDYDNCRPDISDRCGRLRVSALRADESYLFFDYIYSFLYDITSKRYLILFAITRDFFHSFFGTAEDDLDCPSSFRLLRDDYSRNEEAFDRTQDNENVEDQYMNRGPLLSVDNPLSSNSTRLVESTQAAIVLYTTSSTQNSESLDVYRRITRRGRSASPTIYLHRSERRRLRSRGRKRE